MTVEKTTNVFISLGKFDHKTNSGTTEKVDKYIVMRLVAAKFIGATYATAAPAARTVTVKSGKLKGRTYKVEYSSSISGTKFQIGYANGFERNASTGKSKQKIKWISVYKPKGVNLKQFLSILLTKITKKPGWLKTPDGVVTRLQTAK
jgi:hypothetical protein